MTRRPRVARLTGAPRLRPGGGGGAWPYLLGAVLLGLGACQRGARPLAVVAGRAVTLASLAEVVSAQTGKPLQQAPPELLSAFFESQLEEEVVLAASPEPADRDLPLPARSARTRGLLAELCPPPNPPSEAEVDAYLQRDGAPVAGERLHLRQLVLPDRSLAIKARERVRDGADFAAVSRELSRAPNAAAGGMLGWVERGQLPPEFEAAVFGLAPGELSAPVASNAGWHVFEVMARLEQGRHDDATDRERARAELTSRKAEAARRACLRELAGRVGVRVDCTGATFPCRNPFEDKT